MMQPAESTISSSTIKVDFLEDYEIGVTLSAPDTENACIVKAAKHKTSKIEVAIKIIPKLKQSEKKL